ncbi:HxlR family transcriptional regulator [Solirubrobacter pauli]|uniref:HxlR family transcriptional regulator n=1 Tax=Solirubrobacter pauli TaxID=166793 RepID=A0A660KZ81_9ACTN|nr:helix-turn-helix domain-containing protein [Solirubrobacter pauli]RKQ86468.1 HxlR family transcriptional regulator [Solirubrobacter pauli]
MAIAPDEAATQTLVRDLLERIGDKWSVVVICQLGGSTRRFNELRRLCAPITQRMLSVTLRGLERDGLVRRTVFDTKPPRVDYALTARGLSLLAVVRGLAGWAESHVDEILESRATFDGD